jgi:hypothetical protein
MVSDHLAVGNSLVMHLDLPGTTVGKHGASLRRTPGSPRRRADCPASQRGTLVRTNFSDWNTAGSRGKLEVELTADGGHHVGVAVTAPRIAPTTDVAVGHEATALTGV